MPSCAKPRGENSTSTKAPKVVPEAPLGYCTARCGRVRYLKQSNFRIKRRLILTLRVVLGLLVAALVVSAGPINFTAPSVSAGGGVTTGAMAKYTGSGAGSNACAPGDCTFVYEDSVGGGPNGHALFGISTSNDPGLLGLFGNIGVLSGATVVTGQTFTVGTIVDTIPGVEQNAAVTLPASIKFIINDGAGTAAADYFTADITSFNMTSFVTSNFGFNLGGVVNLQNFSYNHAGCLTAACLSLDNLVANAPGILQENFTIASGPANLTALFTAGTSREAAFSLSVGTVPEPRFYGLLLCGLLGLAGIVIRRRKSVNA
jgi:hypothetical protein